MIQTNELINLKYLQFFLFNFQFPLQQVTPKETL